MPFQRCKDYIDIAGRSPAMGRETSAGSETCYFRAKCPNITRQMALTAAALLQTSRYLIRNLFSRRIGAIFGMLRPTHRGGFVSVSWAFLYYTVLSVYVILINLGAQSFRSLQSVSNHQI